VGLPAPLHADVSKDLEQDGLSVMLISAGKFKTEGNPYGPLTDEARAHIQGAVDQRAAGIDA